MNRFWLLAACLVVTSWIAGCGETPPPAKPGPRPVDSRSAADGDEKSAARAKGEEGADNEMGMEPAEKGTAETPSDEPADDSKDEPKDE